MTPSGREEILLHRALRHLDGGRLGPFMPLGKICPRLLTPFLGLRIDSNSPRKSGFVFLEKEKKPVISHLEKCASTRLLSNVVLGSSSIHPSWNS